MITLLSPAKNLDFTSEIKTDVSSTIPFPKETEQLVKKLKKLKPKGIADLMHLSEKLAQLNYERYQSFEFPFEEEDSRQAIFAFNGEVYNGFDASSLSNEDLNYSQRHLKILSGLYGLLSPLDKILPYRLEMGTKFATSAKNTNLYHFWGSKIAQALNQELSTHDNKTIINLASTEYFKAVDKKHIASDIITPTFKDNKNGNYKVVMMYAKKARGTMARFIMEQKLHDINDLKSFNGDGYLFNENLSEKNDWVFTRG